MTQNPILSVILTLISLISFTIIALLFSFYFYIKTSPNRRMSKTSISIHQQQKTSQIKESPQKSSNSKSLPLKQQSPYYELTILLGSGGHTGQLSLLLKNLHFLKAHRLNVLITSTDNSSKTYFHNLLKDQINSSLKDKVIYFDISRTNQVKQSYLTSIFTTLKSTLNSMKIIRNSLINTTHFVSNGPGTCVPFFFLFYVIKKMGLTRTKLIFIQSWCRVDSISLSGKIVRFFTDKFIVHWEEQKLKYPWADYFGKIL